MRGTRKQKAAELLRLINQGPTIGRTESQLMMIGDVHAANQRWLQTWIVPLVMDLLKKDLPPTNDTVRTR